MGLYLGHLNTHDFHTSPFMTRPKPGAPHRRVIIDLSFPHGQAVNSNISKTQYLGTEFVLTLPSIDIITNKVKKFGKGLGVGMFSTKLVWKLPGQALNP